MLEPAYIEILDTNKELRKELANEIADNDSREKKIASLNKELESCYNTISHYDSLIIAHEEEIASLKSEISYLKRQLYTALQDTRQKEEHLISRDSQLQELEDKIVQLRNRIKELTEKPNPNKKFPLQETQMAVPDLLANIGTALDLVERSIGGDTTINPINTLNGIRITLATIRGHMHRSALDAVNMQGLLNTANRRINDFMGETANLRTDNLRMDQAWRDKRRAC